jgi:hypothetical protein
VGTQYKVALNAFEETLERLDLPREAVQNGDTQREMGRRGALLAASEVAWRDHLGPLLPWREVTALLGRATTRQGIHDLAKRRRLLALPTQGGQLLYPLFQFHAGRTLPEIPFVLKAFEPAELDPWTIASWFVTPQELLSGETPVEWLKEQRPAAEVLEAARRSAGVLAR